MKYSEKQNYRKYKTKTEPKLHQSIKIDEEDDIITAIKKAFGIENKKNTNYYGPEDIITSGADYIQDPEPIEAEQVPPPRYIREQEPEIPAPKTPARRLKQDLPMTTPPIATELTGPLVKPKPKTSSEKLQILLNKTKSRSAPSSPGTAAAKERLDEYSSLSGEAKTIGLTEKEEKKLQEHLKTQYVELTNDDINYFRANYKLTGYLPGVGTFGRTAADREKKRKEFEKTSLEMFKSMKAAESKAK